MATEKARWSKKGALQNKPPGGCSRFLVCLWPAFALVGALAACIDGSSERWTDDRPLQEVDPAPAELATPEPWSGVPSCVVDYDDSGDWGSGFQGGVTITNRTGRDLTSWQVTWTFPGDQMIYHHWDADIVQRDDVVEADNLQYNGEIAHNSALTFGFLASYSGDNIPPTDFALNGIVCDGQRTDTPTPRPTSAPEPTDHPLTAPSPSPTPGPGPTVAPTPTLEPAQPTPAPSPPPLGGSCLVYYDQSKNWGVGFVGDVEVFNLSGQPLDGWQVTWTFPGDQATYDYWDVALEQNGQKVTGENLYYNGGVPDGGSFAFGFLANYSGPNESPRDFSLNGQRCEFITIDEADPTPEPEPTPGPTPESDPTPIPWRGDCLVEYDRSDDWAFGFVADVTIYNGGGTDLKGWTLSWRFPGNQAIAQYWNTDVSQDGKEVTAGNLSYNSRLEDGASVNFGFLAYYSGVNASPASFNLNGAECDVRTIEVPEETATPEPALRPTPTPEPTPYLTDKPCYVSYDAGNDWGGAFVAYVEVVNLSGARLSEWQLAWTFPDEQTITNWWETAIVQNHKSVVASSLDYNDIVPDGESVSFGFQAFYLGENNAPLQFVLNDMICETATIVAATF